MSSTQASSLSAINSATLGADMPEITLANGTRVQTGTVGALVVNIKAYNRLVANTPDDTDGRTEMEEKLKAAVPLLDKVGFFDLFSPDDFIDGSSNPGRKYVGHAAKEYLARQE